MSDPKDQNAGRTSKGTFAPGNKLAKGGPRPGGGRKPEVVKQAEQALMEKWGSSDNLDRYFARLDALAADKDPDVSIAAIKLLMDRILGRPQERKELSTPDGSPLLVVDL